MWRTELVKNNEPVGTAHFMQPAEDPLCKAINDFALRDKKRPVDILLSGKEEAAASHIVEQESTSVVDECKTPRPPVC